MWSLLPIIERELRSRSRRPLVYWLRMGLAAVGAVLVGTTVSSWSAGGWQRNDLAFHYLARTGFVVALVSAFATMDIICRERRDGTLGLLFLTELSGVQVVVGKFVASAFNGVLVMAGFTPVLMVALLPGGVTGSEVARVALVLLETLLLAQALGIWVSACAPDLLAAARTTTVRVLVCLLLPALALAIPGPLKECGLVSPLAAFFLAHSASYQPAPFRFWISVALLLMEAIGLIVLAGKALASNWREESPRPERIEPVVSNASRRSPSKPLGDSPPIPWLVDRQRRQRALFWLAAILMSFVGSFGLFFRFIYYVAGPTVASSTMISAFVVAFATVGSTAALAMFALAAGQFFLDAQHTRTIELLLTTPIGVRDLIRGQKLALGRLIAGPLVIIIMPACTTFLILFCFNAATSAQLAPWHAVNLALSAVRQILNVLTACMLGVWFGLHCRNAWTLMGWAAGLTAGVQWLTGLVAGSALRLAYLLLPHAAVTQAGNIPFILRFQHLLTLCIELIPAVVLILWANYRITQDLAGLSEMSTPWRDLFDWLRRTVTGVQRLRHWTPSGSA